MSALNLPFSFRKNQVLLVVADHRLVGRDRDDLELVDLWNSSASVIAGAGHAGELRVQAEVVLEGDGGEGHGLALDAQALLGLHRLVDPLAPAPVGHLAAGELVDDDDLAVPDDVVAITLVERVAFSGRVEVARQPRIVVQVLDAEPLLDLRDPLLGRRDGAVLEVDEVVAALLLALGSSAQPRHQAGNWKVEIGGIPRLGR